MAYATGIRNETETRQSIKRVVAVASVDDWEQAIPEHCASYSRIYMGSEFCPELLPPAEELARAVRIAQDAGLALTFCTPPVPERSLSRVLGLMDVLAGHAPQTEVVANDWGVLRALQPYPFPLSAGRTFQKNKRDPRILTLWPGLSPAMQAFYAGNNVLQPSFLAFLRRFRVTRVEIDLPPWGIDPRLLRDSGLPISLHVPYTYVTTSHVCPTLATVGATAAGNDRAHGCARPCLETTFTLKNPAFAVPLHLRGNTYFIENEGVPDSELLAGSAVDRIVWHGPLPEGCP